MSTVITAFFMAWGMFWIVPCPLKRWDEGAREGMLLFLPLIGAMIGGLWGAAAWLRSRLFPGTLGAAALALVPCVLSGGIHLDGLMDCADAVLSRRDLETRRKILKDSHVGSFAVIAVCALFLLSFGIFADHAFDGCFALFPFLCAVPRAYSTAAVLNYTAMPGSSYEVMFRSVSRKSRAASWVILAALVLLPIPVFGRAGFCAFFAFLGSALSVLLIRRDLRGMSGDVSGAGITIGELCGLIALYVL